MTVSMHALGIDRLSIADRIALVQEIWDSIATEAAQTPFTVAEREEIERRLAAHEADPSAAVPWEQVEAEARARLRR